MHALDEIGSVLAPGGILLDLRPVLDRWPIEVTRAGGSAEAGRSTDLSEPLSDDAAANAAMDALVASGKFVREQQETFPFFYYWDTPKEMQEYIEEEWSDVILIEEAVWKELRSAWTRGGAEARVRLRLKMLITRYRKNN